MWRPEDWTGQLAAVRTWLGPNRRVPEPVSGPKPRHSQEQSSTVIVFYLSGSFPRGHKKNTSGLIHNFPHGRSGRSPPQILSPDPSSPCSVLLCGSSLLLRLDQTITFHRVLNNKEVGFPSAAGGATPPMTLPGSDRPENALPGCEDPPPPLPVKGKESDQQRPDFRNEAFTQMILRAALTSAHDTDNTLSSGTETALL